MDERGGGGTDGARPRLPVPRALGNGDVSVTPLPARSHAEGYVIDSEGGAIALVKPAR